MENQRNVNAKVSHWNKLPGHLTNNIFRRLDVKYLFCVVSLVCSWGQLNCWDILFGVHRGLLHFRDLSFLCDADTGENGEDKMGLALSRVMISLHGKVISLLKLTVNQLSDRHLVYVAQRTPKLQRLQVNMSGITGEGFSRAICNWKDVETIYMVAPRDDYHVRIFQEVGISCGKLKKLIISSDHPMCSKKFHLDDNTSLLLAINTHSLNSLVLKNCFLTKFGLLNIVSKCDQLQVVCLKKCWKALEDGDTSDAQTIVFEPKSVSAEIPSEDWSMQFV